MSEQEYLDGNILDELIKIGNKYNIGKIVLLGSRARKDNKTNSDIDLAVFADKRTDNESKIYFEIEEINTLYKIDIVFIKQNTDKKLLENIEREGIVLYEKEQQ